MYNKIYSFIENSRFKNFIIMVIVFNGIVLGLETSKDLNMEYGRIFEILNYFVVIIFTIEITLRIYIHRVSFFKDPWSLFDFFIVVISLVPANNGFEVLRIFRVFRLFRLVTVVPQMRKIVLALVKVMPGMGAISALLMIIFYVFAIMATNLYAETFPQWFGSLSESIYTLFQIMTLESWSMGIVRPVLEVHSSAWIFFIPYILIATFIMINLIIAVVVDAMSELTIQEESVIVNELHTKEKETIVEIKELRAEIKELKELILKKG